MKSSLNNYDMFFVSIC